MDESIFKAYDIRGIYPDQVDEEAAWKIGYAAAQFARAMLTGYQRGLAEAQALCAGHDMRTHSPSLAKAMVEGMNASGANVIDIGLIDTPQIYFAINHFGSCGGIQVTASHNPAKYNGFKISGLQAKPIGVDTGLRDIKHIATSLVHTKGKAIGKTEHTDLWSEYKKHVRKFLHPKVRPLKVAIDASNGMAGKAVPILFDDVPIEVFDINFTHDGTFKHDPNPLVEKNLEELKQTVTEKGCDFGICFDGDADRLMMVDETGATIPCDMLTALMAPYFLRTSPQSAVVYDLRSSRVVAEEILAAGGTPRRERVGHSFMKKALRDSHGVFGGELSGHFYYAENFYADSAVITMAHVLNIVSAADKPISELIKPLKRYHTSGEINFEVENKQAMMDQLARSYSDAQIDNLDGVTIAYKTWWFNCRPSNTEPLLRLNVEAQTAEMLDEKLAELEQQLGKPVDH